MKTNRNIAKKLIIASAILGTSTLFVQPAETSAQGNYFNRKVVATACYLNGQIYAYSNDCGFGAGACHDRSCP